MAANARSTGCDLLLDVDNGSASCPTPRRDLRLYVKDFPIQVVGEVRSEGRYAEDFLSVPLLIDSHGVVAADPFWALYAEVIARIAPVPTLVEWDNNSPEWPVLAAEAARVYAILIKVARNAA